MRTIGAVCVATMVLLRPSGAVEPCIPNASPSDGIEDSIAIQACLNKGGLVSLSPGQHPGYLIERGLKMGSNTTLTSTGAKATLAAHSTLGAEPILDVLGFNWHISEVVFDGRKYERDALGLCWSGDKRGYNLKVDGTDFSITHVDTVNAMCGTGLEVVGTDFEIAFVFSAYNGREVGEWPNAPYQWSDGMTVVYCENGDIHDNTFIDNTDFDLLFGGGPNCSVHHNDIYHQIRFAFAGLNVGNMDAGKWDGHGSKWRGNHEGSNFFQNRVSSNPGMLMYGLSVGSHPFTRGHRNIRGAQCRRLHAEHLDRRASQSHRRRRAQRRDLRKHARESARESRRIQQLPDFNELHLGTYGLRLAERCCRDDHGQRSLPTLIRRALRLVALHCSTN